MHCDNGYQTHISEALSYSALPDDVTCEEELSDMIVDHGMAVKHLCTNQNHCSHCFLIIPSAQVVYDTVNS